ncbi:hypothetical protein DOTSEDRAFT_89986 [Dothistroma septosporum NZE10]|uniref:Nucleic acid-binding protein n=1 Tax=Dothistroma septosporum (strain NZE10 / CBS 128990) TaxID=675120 RepID=N1PM87_DOTSN|nr:hypothetical protein DOTSEDRAFT_89986 [Dothistroma septosporum NZE10]
MSRPAFSLPIRVVSSSKSKGPQWVCRRCLATQAGSSTSTTPIPPANLPDRSVTSTPAYDPTLPASQRIGPNGNPYRLTRRDFLLKKPLGQAKIPPAYLQHSTAEHLHINEKAQREQTVPHKDIVGVVVSHGKMDRTVKVRLGKQTWNPRIGKYFKDHDNLLVHDPNNSLTTGDVVSLHRLRVSKQVGHVVAKIVSPFGAPIDQRPPIPDADDRLAAYKEKRFAKLDRRYLRRKAAEGDAEAIEKLKNIDLDPGKGAKAGVGKGKKDNVQAQVDKSRNPGKGAILGEKGQKLPEGVLPGGLHEVGKINPRAKYNKQKAMKYEAQAVENLAEAKEKEKQLEQRGLGSDSALR